MTEEVGVCTRQISEATKVLEFRPIIHRLTSYFCKFPGSMTFRGHSNYDPRENEGFKTEAM